MGLSKKTFLYSIILASIMVALVVGYFVAMLPSLYVDYVMDQNLGAIQEQHDSYVRRGSYEGIRVRTPPAYPADTAAAPPGEILRSLPQRCQILPPVPSRVPPSPPRPRFGKHQNGKKADGLGDG